jgi:DNA processing protein
MGALKYWIWLTNLGKTTGLNAYELLEWFGSPEAAYAAEDRVCQEIPGLMESVRQGLSQKNLERAEAILEDCARLRLRVLTLQDTEYPERLRQIPQPPCVLYVKGQLPQMDEELAIALVGARKATPYGEITARKLAIGLACQGTVLVSGIAQGVDSAALKGALTGGGQVVSVLGNGIDVVYPRSSESLYEDIPLSGALVSEYPPGTLPESSHFPVRNRLISGLALGTVVVEGDEQSGSLITARCALEQNRDVFAVPGNWDAPISRGPNRLIQKGEAKLIMDPWDILEEYEHTYPHKIHPRQPLEDAWRPVVQTAPPRPSSRQKAPEQPGEPALVIDLAKEPEALTDDERVILLALGGKLSTADDIIETTGLPTKRILSALTMLQVRGLVLEEAGKRFRTPVVIKEPER